MPKVLIISTPFFGYQESVGRAFSALGYEVMIETYDEPIHPFKGLLRWRHKLARDKERLRAQSRARYDLYIKNVYDAYQPDIVFSYNGTILLDERLDYFRQKSKVILWMYDSVLRPDRERCKLHIDHADAVFCFEQKDVDYYASVGKKAYFLPLACDTSVYYPIAGKPKDIDILFVATIYTSPKRIAFLHSLVKRFPEAKILIYGAYKPYFKNPVKWLFREKRHIYKNVNIPPDKVNELFSRSRVALNIHHAQTFCGANQRLFEACGAGAYQVCDYNPYIASLFANGEVGLYRTEEEMLQKVDYALRHDMAEQASAAHAIIMNGHTFEKRVEEMLRIIGR